MPNRILREGIIGSKRVAELVSDAGWFGEVFYRRLHSRADDFGRFPADPELLRPELFPRQLDKVREADISRLLAACDKARLIRLYTMKGERYLEILDFRQQSRSKVSKFPAPESQVDGVCAADATHTHSMCAADATHMRSETYAETETETETETNNGVPPSGVLRNSFPHLPSGKESVAAEQQPDDRDSVPPGFASFWKMWPKHFRKKARSKCLRHWKSRGLEKIAENIVLAVERQKSSAQWLKDGGQFVPGPLPWLNDEAWEAPASPAEESDSDDNGFVRAEITPELLRKAFGEDYQP